MLIKKLYKILLLTNEHVIIGSFALMITVTVSLGQDALPNETFLLVNQPRLIETTLDFKDPTGDDPATVVATFKITLMFNEEENADIVLRLEGKGTMVKYSCMIDGQHEFPQDDSLLVTKNVGKYSREEVVCGQEKIEGYSDSNCSGTIIGPLYGASAIPQNGRWFCISWIMDPLMNEIRLAATQMPRANINDRDCALNDSTRCLATTGIQVDAAGIPAEYRLMQNYPNPFNPTTNISYSIPNPGYVTIQVYDVLGREIKTLVNEFQGANTYIVNFDSSNLSNDMPPSGVYFYRLRVGNEFVKTRKMLLMR